MLASSMPRRTISLATDDGPDDVQLAKKKAKRASDMLWRHNNPASYRKGLRIRVLRASIKTAYRIQETLRGKIPTLENELAKLLKKK